MKKWCGKPCFKVCKIKDGKVGNALPNCTFELRGKRLMQSL